MFLLVLLVLYSPDAGEAALFRSEDCRGTSRAVLAAEKCSFTCIGRVQLLHAMAMSST
jgi:hypothetical protein